MEKNKDDRYFFFLVSWKYEGKKLFSSEGKGNWTGWLDEFLTHVPKRLFERLFLLRFQLIHL